MTIDTTTIHILLMSTSLAGRPGSPTTTDDTTIRMSTTLVRRSGSRLGLTMLATVSMEAALEADPMESNNRRSYQRPQFPFRSSSRLSLAPLAETSTGAATDAVPRSETPARNARRRLAPSGRATSCAKSNRADTSGMHSPNISQASKTARLWTACTCYTSSASRTNDYGKLDRPSFSPSKALELQQKSRREV